MKASTRGLPPRTIRADLPAARAVPAVDLQQRPQPRLRQLGCSLPRLLPAAVDDACLRRLLGLGTRPPCDWFRVVLRGAGLLHRPQLVRRWPAGALAPRLTDRQET